MPYPMSPAIRSRALEAILAADRESVTIYTEALEAGTLAPAAEGQPHAVDVTIIRPGLSRNGLRYSPAVLERAVPLFEGAAAMADHPDALDLSRAGGRSIRDVVGVYHSPRYVPGHGIKASLSFLPAGEWAYSLVKSLIESRAAGRPMPPIGVSADLLVVKQAVNAAPGTTAGRHALFDVLSIESVNSADLVFRPAAGGSFDRVIEGTQDIPIGDPVKPQAPTPPAPATALEAELAAVREARAAICAEILAAKLSAAALPEPATAQIRERFAGRAFEASELDQAIAKMRELVGAIGPSPIRGAGALRVQMGLSARDQLTIAIERLFGIPVPDVYSHVPRLSGIREAYLLITGDYNFSGRPDPERAIAREAGETTTTQMDSVVANVMNKRLLLDYQAQPKWWQAFVTVVDIRDMKVQTRIRLNDFGGLATVAENGPYVNVAWGDAAETYTPVKKGNLVYVTMEAIINDDTRAFTRIPRKLAAAATVTINEFVSGLFTNNPTLADATAVFAAGRGNIGAAELDATSLAAAITAMRKFTNSASKVIGLIPRFLLVPPDLEFTAFTLVNSTLLPGSTNNDINALRGIVTPITVPNFTDANNWYLIADPTLAENIELGFLNGREAPELLVQDDPRTGTVFTNDAITWKVRWIFGGNWLDPKSAYGAIVA